MTLAFDDGSHCHWSYRQGRYVSFLNWPTEADVLAYLDEEHMWLQKPDPEPYRRHRPGCAHQTEETS